MGYTPLFSEGLGAPPPQGWKKTYFGSKKLFKKKRVFTKKSNTGNTSKGQRVPE